MERKLAEYRARKKRGEFLEKSKVTFKNMFNFSGRADDSSADTKLIQIDDHEHLLRDKDKSDVESETSDVDDNINCCSYADMVYYLLWFILWATVYMIFIKLQFGMVYLVLSALIGMYLNTRTKKANEVSAYSVFNKNCESIDGTLKAEELEKQMIYGRIF